MSFDDFSQSSVREFTIEMSIPTFLTIKEHLSTGKLKHTKFMNYWSVEGSEIEISDSKRTLWIIWNVSRYAHTNFEKSEDL